MPSKRIIFSEEELSIDEIESYFVSSEKALRSFYQRHNLYFIGYTPEELNDELEKRIDELEKSTVFTVLATIEAHLRVNFLQ